MKEFKTLSQQLNILRDRGLNIPTDDKPKKVLREENYYSIINGYKELFLGPNVTANDQSETYIKGSSFYELKSVYVFDRSIRSILLKVILKVEKQFKSIVSYEFSKIHGYNNYLKQSSFDDSKIYGSSKKTIFKYENKIGRINKLIADVQRNISYYYKKKDYIKHYVNKYGYVPLWVLVNTMSFGTISTFFYLMKIGEQVTISKNYKLPKEHLVRYMKVLSEIRNICAHDERLYSIVLSKESEIPDTIHHINLQISKVNTKYTYGKNDFFAILIALKDVLDNKDFGKIIDEIDCELEKLSSILKTIPIESIMDKMGLPNNWKQIKII